MSEEQLASLLGDPSMREAVSATLERSDGGREELEYADVSDVLSSGQWGRLIESGVLVGGRTGFTFTDPDAVRQRLDGVAVDDAESTVDDEGSAVDDEGSAVDDEGSAVDDAESAWAWYDKAAGATTLVLFAGYWNVGIRDTIASFDDLVLHPITSTLPFYAVVLILALVTGLYSTLLQARLLDTETLGAYRERMQRLKERKAAAENRDDEEALERIQREQMDAATDQLGMFKLQFRPMVWIMLLTIPVFLWLRWKVRGGHLGPVHGLVVPLAGPVSWQEPLFGPMSTWIVWYFVCSVASRQIVQKTLGVRTSPS